MNLVEIILMVDHLTGDSKKEETTEVLTITILTITPEDQVEIHAGLVETRKEKVVSIEEKKRVVLEEEVIEMVVLEEEVIEMVVLEEEVIEMVVLEEVAVVEEEKIILEAVVGITETKIITKK
jgi:hypothetical protein